MSTNELIWNILKLGLPLLLGGWVIRGTLDFNKLIERRDKKRAAKAKRLCPHAVTTSDGQVRHLWESDGYFFPTCRGCGKHSPSGTVEWLRDPKEVDRRNKKRNKLINKLPY